MKVGIVQHDIVWEDRTATLGRLDPMVAAAVAQGARLVVLPEMFAVGFSMDTAKVAEDPAGPTETWLLETAAEHDVWVCGSVPVRFGAGVRNRFVLASPTGVVSSYDKVKPFTHGGEAEHYEAGVATTTWDVDGLRVTPFVCYDLRFAPLWWERGPTTDLFVCVASWPARRAAHWRSLLVGRAIENQTIVIGCNRVGSGGGLDYCGGSIAIDALGTVLADAGDAEQVVTVDVDPAVTAEIRRKLPFLADR